MAIPLSRPSRFSAVRSPVSSARASPATRATSPCTTSPSLREVLEFDLGIQLAEDGLRDLEAADDAALLQQQRRFEARVPRERPPRSSRHRRRRPRRGTSARRSRSVPRLELRLAPGPEDGVQPVERPVLVGKVDAEVTAATLLALERAPRDERREQMRRRHQTREPVGVGTSPPCSQSASRSSGVTGASGSASWHFVSLAR